MNIKKNYSKLLFLSIALTIPLKLAIPYNFGTDILSQKTAHENNIRERLSRGIESILKPNEYVVNVNIVLEKDELAAAKKAERDAKTKELLDLQKKERDSKKKDSTTDSEKDPQKNAAETPEAATVQKATRNVTVPTITAIERYDNGENSLFIDKFDFSTPLELILPEQQNAKATEQAVQQAVQAAMKQAMPSIAALQPQSSQQPMNLVQATPLSIMDRIIAIDIELILDEKIPELRYDMVQKLINKINIPVANITPKVTYSKMPLIPPADKKKNELEDLKLAEAKKRAMESDHMKLIKDMKLPIAIILAVIILGILGYFILTRAIKFGNKFLGAIDDIFSKSPAQQASEHAATGDGGEGFGAGTTTMQGGSLSLDDDVPLVGFDRFMSLLKASPNEALLLVRRWINNPLEGSVEALTIIVKKSSTDDLLYMFDNLSINERANWKKQLHPSMNRESLRLGDCFIEAQIMDDIIMPPPTLDKESKKILSNLTPTQCAQIIRQDPEIGCILLNVLPVDFISSTFEHLDNELMLNLSDYGLNYTDGLLNEKAEDLKNILLGFKDEQNRTFAPYKDKLIEMIPIVGINREKALFQSLFNNGEEGLLKEVAHKNFPAELIEKLPEDLIRKNIMKYPRNQRVEFLLSLDETKREFYLSVFGTKTAKMRSFIDADLDLVRDNPGLMKKIQNNADKIGKVFILFFRRCLAEEESFAPEVDKIIDQWVEFKKSNTGTVIQDQSENLYKLKEAA